MKKQHSVYHTIDIVLLILLPLISGCTAPLCGTKSSWRIEEHVYKQTPQGGLSMFIHLPQGWKPTDKRPAIVFFFGGAFRTGKITEFVRHAEYFCERGMVSVRADYRVKDRHGTMPDKCVEDAKSAIRWLRANAGRFGIDPDRIAASGHSAGGTVAACTYTAAALDAEGENLAISSKPDLLALFNTPLEINYSYRLYLGSEAMADSLSPNDHLTEGFPPTVLFYAGLDGRHFQDGIDLVLKSRGLGNAVELYAIEDRTLDAPRAHNASKYSPWFERTLFLLDRFLGRHGYVQGKPVIRLPEGRIKMGQMTPSNPGLKDRWGYTELHYAARIGDVESTRVLIEGGAEVDAKDWWGYTPISYAIGMSGDQELVQVLIDGGADLHLKDKDGTLLHYATRCGNKDGVDLLLTRGLDVNAQDDSNDTALYYAAAQGHQQIVELLLQSGANVNTRGYLNRTAVESAMSGGHTEIVELLIAKGADVSPLHLAIHMKDKAKARNLIEGGADVNERTPYGTTPLERAAYGGSKDIAELLMAKGADVNAKDNWNWTALHGAAERGYRDIVQLLLAKGADVSAKDGDGMTPLWYAKEKGHTEIAELLRKREAKK